MKKGDVFIAKESQRVYEMVGRWDRDIVLAIISDDSEEVLVYGPAEFENLISEGRFRKLHRTGIKIKE